MTLSQEQLKNAATIYQVGRSMGLGTRDIQIGLMAALVESGLINVNYGDRDSLGLFQQRPSQGWGTPEQVRDPQYAARKFFQGLTGLGQSRFQMNMGAAAQAVQRSAYPDRYQQQLGTVQAAWPLIGKGAGDTPMGMDGQPFQMSDSAGLPIPSMESMVSAVQSDPGIPSASTMLGAWGMNAPQPVDPVEVDPLMNGAGSFLSSGTNDQLLQQFQVSGNFQKGVDGWRSAVIDAAKSALGKPYVWGGSNLSSGVDCSGLVMAAYARAGIDLPRISYQQANSGARVGIGGLQPGDLVAWDNSSRNSGADHIAIYLGNGQIIESPRPGLSVRIRKLGANLEGGWGVHMNGK